MTRISTIDIQTRLDVHELLSHFSHFLDHNRGACWADLFTTDGVFECPDGRIVSGPAALAGLPAKIEEKGHGSWRHLINAVVIERCHARKDLVVRAYCQVIDMGHNSTLAAFYDFEFLLRFAARWKIRHVLVKHVGASMTSLVGAAAMASSGAAGMALQ